MTTYAIQWYAAISGDFMVEAGSEEEAWEKYDESTREELILAGNWEIEDSDTFGIREVK